MVFTGTRHKSTHDDTFQTVSRPNAWTNKTTLLGKPPSQPGLSLVSHPKLENAISFNQSVHLYTMGKKEGAVQDFAMCANVPLWHAF